MGDDPGAQPAADVDSGGADAPATSDAQTADETPAPPVDAGGPDGDGGCNSTMPFLTLATLGNSVNTTFEETAPRLTADELVLYYTAFEGTTLYTHRVSRASTSAPWTGKTTFYDRSVERVHVWTSSDERYVYYSQRDVATANRWQLSRATLDGGVVDFAFFANDLNGPAPTSDLAPYAAPDRSEIWWESNRASANVDAFDIYSAPALPDGGGFGAAQAATELNTTGNEAAPVLSSDKLTIYFASSRGRKAGTSIWMSTRLKASDPFKAPALAAGLGPLEDENATIAGSALPGWISPDDCRLYVSTTKDDGSADLYVASRR